LNTATLVERAGKRHSNPLSVWTRLLSYPLVFVPFWNRIWKQGDAVAAWFAANPVLFSEPENRGAWATQAVVGEKLWTTQRPLDPIMMLNVNSAALGTGGIWSAHKRRFWPMVFFVSAGVLLLLWCIGRYASYYDQHHDEARDSHRGERWADPPGQP
jgi:hypothetical protein